MKKVFLITFYAILTLSCNHKKGNEQVTSSTIIPVIKPEGVLFAVDDVEPADSLLLTDTAKKVIENKIGKEIKFMPEEQQNSLIVPCGNNGLIQTLQECYDNHRPLVLTPDIIWLAICQGVSLHINENYDSLKNVIFTENKPDTIKVRNDSLEYSSVHWKDLIDSIANRTKQYTKKDYFSFFVSDFSTTTPVEKTAYQITLLESYKKGFKYVGDSGCGIPSILIAGNQDDWMTILQKLNMLDLIGLSYWRKNLEPIILQFIKASKDDPDPEFWKSIYKNASEYNAFYISGWIIKFFPYVKTLDTIGVYDETREATKISELLKKNEFLDDNDYMLSTLSTDNFPSGLAKISIEWNNYFKRETKNIEVYSGFMGIKQYEDKSLEPMISWAICDENAKKPEHKLVKNINRNLNHKPDYWSPHIAKRVTDSAIYDIKSFKTQFESLEFIKKIIVDSLQTNGQINNVDYLNDTIQFIVFANGKIGNVTMQNSANPELSAFVGNIIKNLPNDWFPALCRPSEVIDELGYPEDFDKIKVRANSLVKIGL
jgi:hypothetical protein